MSINIIKDPEPAKKAGEHINEILAKYADTPVLFLIAGGSSRAVLDYIDEGFLGPELTITVTDDRYTKELDHNNFAVLQTTDFYNKAVSQDVCCINTEVWGDESQEEVRMKFEKNLRDWRKDFPKGKIIGLYGIGEDGHTAGIITRSYLGQDFLEKFSGKNFVESVDAKDLNAHPQRITTTFTFMKEIDFPIFYITGKGKQAILSEVLKQGSLEEVPGRIIHSLPNAVLITDCDVA